MKTRYIVISLRTVEVFTLPVAAKPTLRATVHVVATQRDYLEERFCFTSTLFLIDIRSVVTCRDVSLHSFPQITHGKHIGNRKQRKNKVH